MCVSPFEVNEYPLIKAVLLSGGVISRSGKVQGEVKRVGRGSLGVGGHVL